MHLSTAVIHEYLEGRHAVIADIDRDTCKLLFGRDDEVIAEVDPRARLRDRNHVVENVLERLGRHQIRNETGDAALGGGCRFAIGIQRHARLRNVLAMAEMQVDIDGPRKNSEAAHGNFRSGGELPAGRHDGGDPPITDGDIAGGGSLPGQDRRTTAQHQIEIRHAAKALMRRLSARREHPALHQSTARQHISRPCRTD